MKFPPCSRCLTGFWILAAFSMGEPLHAQEPSLGSGPLQMVQLVSPEWKTMTQLAGATWDSRPGVEGDMFFNADWTRGYVLFSDHKMAKDEQLRYNVFTNEIYFNHQDTVRVIDKAAPVVEFGFGDKTNAIVPPVVFRRGYPAAGKNTGETFYQVLVDGKLELLKLHTKSVSDRLNGMTGPEKVIIDSEDWYVYDTGAKKIFLFKNSRASIKEVLPRYSSLIDSIADQQQLRLKKDADWIKLILQLNEKVKTTP